MKINLLGAAVDGLTMGQFVERIALFVEEGDPCFVITLNPELLYRAQYDEDLLAMINRADLVTADGVGIVWACRAGGRPVPGRVTGIDLMMRLLDCAAGKGWRVFFLGSRPGVAEAAARRAAGMFPGLRVAGTHHGYFSDEDSDEVAGRIKNASPHLLFVALGSPRQERWIDQHLNLLGSVVAMGVGGSLDVLSGNVRRAPEWFRRWNLEWLGRLLNEPGRWRRMLVLPKFALMVLMTYKFKIGKSSVR
ncbi:MAG: WecB/TagA/CpsF family glycosyltransferase [Bacillota bacterium]